MRGDPSLPILLRQRLSCLLHHFRHLVLQILSIPVSAKHFAQKNRQVKKLFLVVFRFFFTGCERIVTRGGVMTVTLGSGPVPPTLPLLLLLPEQRGEIPRLFFSAERGCSRSGERARLRRGEPGSADLGR